MQIPGESEKTFLDRKSVLFIGATFALSIRPFGIAETTCCFSNYFKMILKDFYAAKKAMMDATYFIKHDDYLSYNKL